MVRKNEGGWAFPDSINKLKKKFVHKYCTTRQDTPLCKKEPVAERCVWSVALLVCDRRCLPALAFALR